jgi:hypothetical protein
LAFAGAPAERDAVIVPALAVCLTEDQDPQVRTAASWALMEIGSASVRAIPSLRHALDDPLAMVRYYAALCLYKLGPRASETLPALLDVLDDADVEVRRWAAEAALQIDPRHLPTAETDHPGPPTVHSGFAELVKLAQCHDDAAFFDALRSPDPASRRVAVVASRWCRLPDDFYAEAAANGDSLVKYLTVIVLRLGVGSMSLLSSLLKDDSDDVRYEAARSFELITPPTAVAVADLIDMLRDEIPMVRRQAVMSLGRIGRTEPEARAACLPLAHTLIEDIPEIAQRAAEVLLGMGMPSKEVEESVLNALKSRDVSNTDGIRDFYIKSLERTLEEAKGVIPNSGC